MVSIICATLLLLPYTNVFSEKGTWVSGHYTCGFFLNACDSGNINCTGGTMWAKGYLSGLTVGSDIPREKIDDDSLKYALIKYCRENPLKKTEDAVASIFRELIK
jgi:hypothetical protein